MKVHVLSLRVGTVNSALNLNLQSKTCESAVPIANALAVLACFSNSLHVNLFASKG